MSDIVAYAPIPPPEPDIEPDFIEPPPKFADRQIEARIAGYSWSDIYDHIGGRVSEAFAAGYSALEIDSYLGRGSQEQAQQRVNGDWSARAAWDDTLVSGLRSARSDVLNPMEELTAARVSAYANADMPEIRASDFIEPPPAGVDLGDQFGRASYANALLRGEVRSPRDFAEQFAGAAWQAAGDVAGSVMTRAANEMAAALPSDEDFTDQAIAISRSRGLELTPDGVRDVKNNLVDVWKDTGEPLDSIRSRAFRDDDFARDLTKPPEPDVLGNIATALVAAPMGVLEFWRETGLGGRDMIGGAKRLVAHSLPEPLVTAVAEFQNSILPLSMAGPTTTEALDAFEKLRIKELEAAGDNVDDIPRMLGQAAMVLPMFTTLGLSGIWGLVAAGATSGAALGAFEPNTAESYWAGLAENVAKETLIGGAFGGLLGVAGRLITSPAGRTALLAGGGAGIGALVADDPGEGALLGLAAGLSLKAAGKAIAAMAPPAARMLRDLIASMPEPKVRVIDPTLPEGMADVPAARALEIPKPAERVPLAEGADPAIERPFLPEATPAEKMQALSRDWGEKPIPALADDPDFFQGLAKGQDPATIEVAAGMDAARGITGFLDDLGGQLMRLVRDESGAINLFRTPQEKIDRALYVESRDFARAQIIAGRSSDQRLAANYNLRFDHAKNAAGKTQNLFKLIQPYMKEFEAELAKGPAGNPMGNPIGNLYEYMEGRSAGITLKWPELAPVADMLRGMYIELRGLSEVAEQQGLHTMKSYYDDYMAHLWKNRNAADTFFGAANTGSARSLHKRTHLTSADGIRAGLEPKYANPIEAGLFHATEALRYLRTLHLLDAATKTKDAAGNPFVYFAHAPKPGDMALIGAGTKRTLPYVSGDVHAYANPGYALSWNDRHGVGFHSRPWVGKTYDGLLYAKNLNVQTQLLLPFFHAKTMVTEALAGGYGNALTELVGGARMLAHGNLRGFGEFPRAAFDVAKTATGVKFFETIWRGHRGIRAYNEMANDPVIKILTDAGSRFGPRQDIYLAGKAETYWHAARRGQLVKEMVTDNWKYIKGDPNNPLDYRLAHVPFRMLATTAHEAGRFLNSFTGPLFDVLIPRLKVGVNIERMNTFLRENPTASPELLMHRARQIVNNTDDRMGEMNMDNIFWPKAVKQAAQLSMISPGWVYGALRFFSGAAGVNLERRAFEWNPVALSSFIGFVTAYSLESSAYQYLKTGEVPWTSETPLHDLIAPRSGALTPKGDKERVLLPSQAKEIFDFAKIIMHSMHDPWGMVEHAGLYVKGKMPGMGQIARGLLTGQDAIGNEIAHTAKGWPGFFESGLKSIFMSTMNDRKKGTGIAEWESFIGFKPTSLFATNPERFWRGLDAADRMHQQQQYNRARRENRDFETPRELPSKPPSAPRKAPRSSTPRSQAPPSNMRYPQ